MASSRQHRQAARLAGVSAASTGKHRPNGPKADEALTIKPDHPIGASHKGRAALIREWLRLHSDVDAGRAADEAKKLLPALEADLHESLSDCLGCKACATQCPVKVDIPAMRSHFWDTYYQSHRRPLRHYLLAQLENWGALMRFAPGLTNMLMRLAKPAFRALGLVDLPHVSLPKSPGKPAAVSTTGNTVVLLEDTFLGTFDGSVIDACQSLLETLGYEVLRHGPVPNGKARHVFGFRAAFAKTAAKRMALIGELSRNGHRLIGIEPSVQAMETSEYRVLGRAHDTHSVERFLEAEIAAGRIAENTVNVDAETWLLFSHCTEKTSDPLSIQRWKFIFAHFGLKLEAKATGCCGMAGTFGHEREHAAMSETLYDLSWRAPIAAANGRALATGFSCRCQIERFSNVRVPHPVELLAKALKQ